MVVYDLIASFQEEGDNPYPTDHSNVLLNKLKIYRKDHPNEFIFIGDWKDHLHSRVQQEQLEDPQPKLFGKVVSDTTKLSDIPKLENAVKRFFIRNTKLEPSKALLHWARNVVEIDGEEIQMDEEEEVEEDEEDEEEDEELNMLLPESNDKLTIPENEISTYNFASNYTITYEALAELCLNQARRSYVSSKARSLEIEKEEVKRRNEICADIRKYFMMPELEAALAPTDSVLEKMPLNELEMLQEQCVDKFNTLKTKHVVKDVVDVLHLLYETLCPDGAPVPFTKKKIVIDRGVSKEITDQLFDERTVVGQACMRTIDKYHFNVRNGFIIAEAVVKAVIEGASIKDRGPTVEEIDDEEEEYDEEEEENMEEEEESAED